MQDIVKAKCKELDNLRQNDVAEEVKSVCQQAVTRKWIIKENHKNKGKIVKARLVTGDFEKQLHKSEKL